MADTPEQDFQPELPDPLADQGAPFEQEELPEDLPRRAASAQFMVESEVGSAAALREAMDPANQSLADALRLSFRVLQFVILVLLILFPMSAFQVVKEGYGGVMLRWGKVVSVGDSDELLPGAHWTIWPYPAGEFVIFDVDGREVDMRRRFDARSGNEVFVEPFWPLFPPDMSRQDIIDQATPQGSLTPGRDGSVLTRDGDIAHLKISAEYDIDDPQTFVQTLNPEDASRVVALAVQRAVVQVMAGASLQELIDFPDDIRDRVRRHAQTTLDQINCGVAISKITLPEASPPMAIARHYGDVQTAREEAKEMVESARSNMDNLLVVAGGQGYRELVQLIDRYEEAEQRPDSQGADELLNQINTFLESDRVAGDLKTVIERAAAYESEIDSTLGSEVRRFKSVLPEYRDNPLLAVSRRLMRTVSVVQNRPDVEIMHVPEGLGKIQIRIKSLEEVSQLRNRLELDRKERDANQKAASGYEKYYNRAQDYELGKARPLLEVIDGKVVPRGSGG